jgi:hypothetical protein
MAVTSLLASFSPPTLRHQTIQNNFHLLKTSIFNKTTSSSVGRRVIVAASPPVEDAVVATRPLTKQDLVDYLASGCKTKDKWRYIFFSFIYRPRPI